MLPGFIDNLKSLQTLDVRSNELKTLPGCLWRLQNLYELRITGNPLVGEWKRLKRKDTEVVLEYCRQKGSVNVFLSYAFADYSSGKYPFDEIADDLKARDDVSYTYHCMQDLKTQGQIDKFMNETIPHCQFIIFFATNNSLKSEDCVHELTLANTHNIKIIPILADNITWDHSVLKNLGLTREFGLKFKDKDIKALCNELYDYIFQYKRKHSVFTREEAELRGELLNIKRTIVNYLESSEFEQILKNNLDKFKNLFQSLNQLKITSHNYFLECAQLISVKKAKKRKAKKKPETIKKADEDKKDKADIKTKEAKKGKKEKTGKKKKKGKKEKTGKKKKKG